MKKSYEFIDLEGNENTVEFETVYAEGKLRTYGIASRLIRNGTVSDTAVAPERFITEEEAEAAIRMLCEFQVTPCTVCDVI